MLTCYVCRTYILSARHTPLNNRCKSRKLSQILVGLVADNVCRFRVATSTTLSTATSLRNGKLVVGAVAALPPFVRHNPSVGEVRELNAGEADVLVEYVAQFDCCDSVNTLKGGIG